MATTKDLEKRRYPKKRKRNTKLICTVYFKLTGKEKREENKKSNWSEKEDQQV